MDLGWGLMMMGIGNGLGTKLRRQENPGQLLVMVHPNFLNGWWGAAAGPTILSWRRENRAPKSPDPGPREQIVERWNRGHGESNNFSDLPSSQPPPEEQSFAGYNNNIPTQHLFHSIFSLRPSLSAGQTEIHFHSFPAFQRHIRRHTIHTVVVVGGGISFTLAKYLVFVWLIHRVFWISNWTRLDWTPPRNKSFGWEDNEWRGHRRDRRRRKWKFPLLSLLFQTLSQLSLSRVKETSWF